MPVFNDRHVVVKAVHNDISMFYFLHDDSPTGSDVSKYGDGHLMLLPERVAVYGDKVYRSALSEAVKNVVRHMFYSRT